MAEKKLEILALRPIYLAVDVERNEVIGITFLIQYKIIKGWYYLFKFIQRLFLIRL